MIDKARPPRLTSTSRRQLVDEAHRLARIEFPEVPPTRACLVEAVSLQCLAYRRWGVDFSLQAGTCFWPRVNDNHRLAKDESSHYGYEWRGVSHAETALAVLTGKLPELHVWLALVEEEVIVDSTTRTFVDRARAAGVSWPGARPPSLLWGQATALHTRYGGRRHAPRYMSSSGACDVAITVAERIVYPKLCAATGLTYMGHGELGWGAR